MKKNTRRWIARAYVPSTAVCLLLIGSSSSPRAATPQESAAAQALFEEAKRLAAAGNYAEACPKFAQSQEIDPAPGTLLHLAACHEGQNKTATALSEFNQALGLARRDGRSDREAYAKSRIQLIERKLVKLTIIVPAGARVTGLVVTRGGRPVPEAEWGAAVPVDPGEQIVEASAPNRLSWISRPQVDEHNRAVALTVPDLPAAPLPQPQPLPASAAAPPPATAVGTPSAAAIGTPPAAAIGTPAMVAIAAPEPPQRADTGSVGRVAGFVLGGAGVLGLGVGALFDIHAHRLAGQRDDAARAGDASGTASLNRDAHAAQTTAFIVGGASLVALGGGIALVVRSHRAPEASIAPQFGPGQVGLVMRVIR
jgi:hypothetical protein